MFLGAEHVGGGGVARQHCVGRREADELVAVGPDRECSDVCRIDADEDDLSLITGKHVAAVGQAAPAHAEGVHAATQAREIEQPLGLGDFFEASHACFLLLCGPR